MIDLKTYNKLKAAVDEKQSEADKAAGAFEQALLQLKKEFGCSTVEEAKIKLAELEEKEKVTAKAYEKCLAEFIEKYGDALNINNT